MSLDFCQNVIVLYISLVTGVEPPLPSGLTVQLRAEIVVTRPGRRGPGPGLTV